MSVRSDRQRSGIGGALVRAGLEKVRDAGRKAAIVLGHAEYYPRFGFSAARARHLSSPFSGEAFMALELEPGSLDGRHGLVIYPPPFGA